MHMRTLLVTLLAGVALAMPSVASAAPAIVVSPPSLTFPSVVIPGSATLALLVSSVGADTLHFSAVITAGGSSFSLVSPPTFPVALAPGASVMLTVRFSPVSVGAKTGSLIVTSDDPLNPSDSVALSGTGTLPVITTTPPSLAFGDVVVPGPSNRVVGIGNSGSASLSVTGTSVTGGDAAAFTLVSPPTFPVVVAPGGNLNLTVRFAPSSGGAKSATLHLASSDPFTPDKTVPLSGTGTLAQATLTPAALDFGYVPVSQSSDLTVNIGSAGSAAVSVSGLAITGAGAASFTILSPPALPVSVPPGLSLALTVRFVPASASAASATLGVTSNDSDTPFQAVSLTGAGLNPVPVIVAVRDVPNDQGGKLKLSWDPSPLDTGPAPVVAHYWVFRSVPPFVALAALEGGVAMARAGDALASHGAPAYYTGPSAAGTVYWELLATVQAVHFIQGYSFVASTLSDSTPTSNPKTLFMVMALDAGNTLHWDSAVDSGYSVDNLAPAAPVPFTGNYAAGATHLHWAANSEADLSEYRLYRGNAPGFVPGPANLLSAQPDTGFADAGAAGAYYKLAAVDLHGNESAHALLGPGDVLDAPHAVPTRLSLSAPRPNPAAGATELGFALPGETFVSLVVFDTQGRRVRELVRGTRPAGEHRVAWDGRDEAGNAVPGGLYFARLQVSGRVLDTRIVRLR
jgi:hypothetical protein